jgi:predicted DNA-binding transcriptional regulator AlpA
MELIVTTRDQLSELVNEAVYKALSGMQRTPEKRPEIIDRDELCRRLNITEPTVIRWEKKGKIPRMEIGSAVRYDWNKVLAALEAKTGGKKFA